jgi:diacylglycerol kinase (ATP)
MLPTPPPPAVERSRILAVLNPIAGRGRGRRAWRIVREILRASGHPFDGIASQSPRDAMERIARAGAEGYGTILSVGGDGTTHWAINGLMHSTTQPAPALAIVPGGTANDFPRSLQIPLNPRLAVRALWEGARRRVDVGRVNDRFFATIAGVGFDAEVAQQVNRWPKWTSGAILYIAGILKTMVAYRPVDARITIDGRSHTQRMFLLAVANTSWYAGGMCMAPHARIDDGSLAVVVAGDLTKLQVLAILPKVYSGRHLNHPKISHTSAREVRVDCEVPLAIHADGETVGKVPAVFQVVPRALEVVVPRESGAGSRES